MCLHVPVKVSVRVALGLAELMSCTSFTLELNMV